MRATDRDREGAPRGGRAAPLAGLAVALAGATAIAIQDHTGALPLGIVNEGRTAHGLLSTACLCLALAAGFCFAVEVARRRRSRPGGVLRGAIASLVLLELMLAGVDSCWLARDPDTRVGGPYHERRNAAGDWVFLKKAHAGSPWGFRTAVPYAKRAGVPRVLFLGDSYTEGSGRAPECNYPEVVQQVLSGRLGRRVQVMNAGVSGYGPLDALHLLDLLLEEGYAFDAIVFNLFLENDFTDDLPATERRVVAGMSFRFPRSRFLRLFHPLNSRLFHYVLFVARVREVARGDARRAQRGAGECRLDAAPADEPSAELRELARRRLLANYGSGPPRSATGVVADALDGMAQRARRLGVPFAIVVFPDRILVDAELQRALGLGGGDHDLERLRRWVATRFPGLPRIDVSPALEAQRGLYRAHDTHLSDLGNRRAGEYVGARLADLLPDP